MSIAYAEFLATFCCAHFLFAEERDSHDSLDGRSLPSASNSTPASPVASGVSGRSRLTPAKACEEEVLTALAGSPRPGGASDFSGLLGLAFSAFMTLLLQLRLFCCTFFIFLFLKLR